MARIKKLKEDAQVNTQFNIPKAEVAQEKNQKK